MQWFTREELKKWLPMLQDFADGAEIQGLRADAGEWESIGDKIGLDVDFSYKYKSLREKTYDNSGCVHRLDGRCPVADIEFGCPCEHAEQAHSFCKHYKELKLISKIPRCKIDPATIFTGTEEQWKALADTVKQQYVYIELTDMEA